MSSRCVCSKSRSTHGAKNLKLSVQHQGRSERNRSQLRHIVVGQPAWRAVDRNTNHSRRPLEPYSNVLSREISSVARTLHPRISTGLWFKACWMSNSTRLRSRGMTLSLKHKNTIILNSKFTWSLSVTQVSVSNSCLNLANQSLCFIHRDSCSPNVPPNAPSLQTHTRRAKHTRQEGGCKVGGAPATPREAATMPAALPIFLSCKLMTSRPKRSTVEFSVSYLFSMILSSSSTLSDHLFSRSFWTLLRMRFSAMEIIPSTDPGYSCVILFSHFFSKMSQCCCMCVFTCVCIWECMCSSYFVIRSC